MSRYLAKTTPTSPKVIVGGLLGLLAAIAVAVLSALLADPTGLGVDLPQWALFLLTATAPVIIQTFAAYMKGDPLRDVGQESLDARTIQGETITYPDVEG